MNSKTNIFLQIRRRAATLLALIGILGVGTTRAVAAVDVVATIPELGAITKEIGGAKVSVSSIAPSGRDYHTIEPRPSDVARVSNADLIVRTGLSLDGWMDALLNAARNPKLNRGGSGYVDASTGIPTIGKPTSSITGASGDVHPEGNPHYYYDPIYAKFAARNIVKGLIRVDGANANYYRNRYTRFNNEIDRRMKGWNARMAPHKGKAVVTYHLSYDYFLRRFGLYNFGQLEPRPGIPPSAKHINTLVDRMKRGNVRAVVIESIYGTKWAEFVKRQANARYIVAPYSVQSSGEGAYFALIDTLVNGFGQALR